MLSPLSIMFGAVAKTVKHENRKQGNATSKQQKTEAPHPDRRGDDLLLKPKRRRGKRKCISRESNPGHIDGNDVFYH